MVTCGGRSHSRIDPTEHHRKAYGHDVRGWIGYPSWNRAATHGRDKHAHHDWSYEPPSV
jgi:hypothetical protein